MVRPSLVAAVFLLACTAATGNAVETAIAEGGDESPLLAVPTQRDQIGRIVAPVMINGTGPFNLMVDTGANSTTFSESLALELGIAADHEASIFVNGVTGRALVPVASVDRLETGALVFTDQHVPIVGPHVLAGADGILGLAALTDRQLIVDFRRNRVSLSISQRLPPNLLRIKAKRLPSGLLTARAKVGGVRAIVIIDTGAERTLGNHALMQALDHPPNLRANVTVLGATTDVSHGNLITVEDIRIGGLRVSNSHVTFGDFHVFDVCDLDDQPALLLGMDIIGRLDLFVIDFRRLEVGFRS